MAVFIAIQLKRGNSHFRNAFFIIYLILSVDDVCEYLTVTYFCDLLNYGIIPPSYVLPIGPVLYFLSGYFVYFQCLSHTVIALNRYTCIVKPMRHQKFWSGKPLLVVILLLFAIPFVASAPQLWMDTTVVEYQTGFMLRNTVPWVSQVKTYVSVSMGLSNCMASAFLEIRSLVAYRNLGAHWRSDQKEDFRLLIHAVIGVVTTSFMTVYWSLSYTLGVTSPQVRDIINAPFPYIIDLLSLSGSVCLLICSKTVRKEYFEFYRFRVLKTTRVRAVPSPTKSCAAA
ncbi:SRG-10 protein [Aphelenchoides avenae]|nr:SRG-10 protein [Aphelenchus avenae]